MNRPRASARYFDDTVQNIRKREADDDPEYKITKH